MSKNYRAELVGLFGDPVDGNPTGVMEEAGFAAKGLDFRYITARVLPEDLPAAFSGAKAMNMRGLNLTMPHKISIIPLLDRLTQAAQIIGAVNTVVNENGVWVGENTDGKGFVLALQLAGADLHGKRVTILGAGGAARAIAVECALAGAAHIAIINRNQTRGADLVNLINDATSAQAEYIPWIGNVHIPAETDILIQATCVGLGSNDRPAIDYDSIHSNMVVSDVVFNPVKPAFLEEAEKRGAAVVSGIGMLVQQGAKNFKLWTGEDAPIDVMFEALKHEFEE